MKWVFGVLACIAAADDSSSLLQHAHLSAKPSPVDDLSKAAKKEIKKDLKMGTRMMEKILSGGGDEAEKSSVMARKLLKKALEGKLPLGSDYYREDIKKELVNVLKNGPKHELKKAIKGGLVTEDEIEGAEKVVEAVGGEVEKDVTADIKDGIASEDALQEGLQEVEKEVEKEAVRDGASPDQIASVEDAVGSAVGSALLQRSTGSQFSNLIAKFHALPDERRKALAKFAATDVEDSQALLAKWQSIPMNHRKELLRLLQLANGADASSMDDAAVLKGKKKKSTPSGGPVTD